MFTDVIVKLTECENQFDLLLPHVEVGLAELFDLEHAAATIHSAPPASKFNAGRVLREVCSRIRSR
jgi:hypothetical protein